MTTIAGLGLLAMFLGPALMVAGYWRMLTRYDRSPTRRTEWRRILLTSKWTPEDNRAGGFLVFLGAVLGAFGCFVLVATALAAPR